MNVKLRLALSTSAYEEYEFDIWRNVSSPTMSASTAESFVEVLRAGLDTSLARTAIAGASMGVLLHATILRVVEVENYLFHFLGLLSASTAALLTAYLASGFPLAGTIQRVSLLNTGFYVALFCSILAYRLFFHRLRRFPGPVGAKVSRFYAASIASKKIQYYKEVDKLHQKYGDFVRTGMSRCSLQKSWKCSKS